MDRDEKIRKRLDEARTCRQQGRYGESFTAYEDVIGMLETPARRKPAKPKQPTRNRNENDELD